MRKGFTLSCQASHHSHPMVGVWATQRDAQLDKVASFALRRALHGQELLVSPLDKEISLAHGNEVHLHRYRKSPAKDNDNE